MSAENVAVVRRIYAAWENGSPLDSGLLSPEIEWVNPPEAIEPGTRRGVEAFGSAARTVDDTFEGSRIDFEEFIDVGDRVLVIGTLRGTGRGSGLEVGRRQGYLWTIRDGKATRFQWFNDPADARRAAGLSE